MTSPEIIKIKEITSQDLRARKYSEIFPEYYDLDKVTENGTWHSNQNVLDHVIRVFEGLETVLLSQELVSDKKPALENYLSGKLDNVTRKEVLIVATLLHDIAKVDTLVKRPDGTAFSPGHELIGATRVSKFSSRFGLNAKDTEYVERIVRYHGFTADILQLIISSKNKEKYFRIFKETVGDVNIELILLMQADLLGSDLGKNDPDGFHTRMDLLKWMLQELT